MGMTVQNEIAIDGKKRIVYKNGQEIDIPVHIKGYGITIINGKVYVSGWELTDNNTWKRTLKSTWHRFFG